MCLNGSGAHARAVMNGLLMDGAASRDGACTSPAYAVTLFCCILVKFALKKTDFEHEAVLIISKPFITGTF